MLKDLGVFLSEFYRPHYNSFNIPHVFGIPFYLGFWILIAILTLFFLRSKSKVLLGIIAAFGFILIVIQSSSQYGYAKGIFEDFGARSMSQKNAILYGNPYVFSLKSLLKVDRSCKGELLTDLDMNQTIEPYILRYFMYPKIDLIPQAGHDYECLVGYENSKGLPKNYHTIMKLNSGFVALRD